MTAAAGSLPRRGGADLRVAVVGAGLMGTSLALALRQQGWPVWVHDRDARAQRLAADVSDAQQGIPAEADLVFLAVPPEATAAVAVEQLRLMPHATVSDVASTKAHFQVEIESREGIPDRFVGGHPIAGRERSGPDAARGDLFEGRPWVLTPGPAVPGWRMAQVVRAVSATGALPVVWSAAAHDAAMAAVSHVPQVVASALAAQLLLEPAEVVELAGSGLRDTTRIAASDPDLWLGILESNADAVADRVRAVSADLAALADALDPPAENREADKSTQRHAARPQEADATVRDLLTRGNAGQHRIPGKHGEAPIEYAVVPVVITDAPGSLARLFSAAGDAGVNVEDVSIEHSPGQPVGLVELSVAPEAAQALREGLVRAGWSVH